MLSVLFIYVEIDLAKHVNKLDLNPEYQPSNSTPLVFGTISTFMLGIVRMTWVYIQDKN